MKNCGEYWRITLDFTGVYAIILVSESVIQSDSDPRLHSYLSGVRAGDRATEFGQRCRQLGIQGVTLHGQPVVRTASRTRGGRFRAHEVFREGAENGARGGRAPQLRRPHQLRSLLAHLSLKSASPGCRRPGGLTFPLVCSFVTCLAQ